MKRDAIAGRLLSSETPPLWVPLLTHYRLDDGRPVVDAERMTRHMAQVAPSVRSWMISGSTGDGWDVNTDQFDSLLKLSADPAGRPSDVRVLVGVLRSSTDAVLEWIDHVHAVAGTSRSASLEDNVARLAEKRWVGITVCPPVGDDVSQEAIIEHYAAVADAARLPLAVYQLPQVTGNVIEPATMARLVAAHDEIILFKDSSGQDTIAQAGVDLDTVVLVRGAEGNYAPMLEPLGGPYTGLLLSTANGFGPHLRTILDHVSAGREDEARATSENLTALVEKLFACAGDAPVGNAFANVNRAVDHAFAHGRVWRDAAPPMLFDGSRLPEPIVASVAEILGATGLVPEQGYLAK